LQVKSKAKSTCTACRLSFVHFDPHQPILEYFILVSTTASGCTNSSSESCLIDAENLSLVQIKYDFQTSLQNPYLTHACKMLHAALQFLTHISFMHAKYFLQNCNMCLYRDRNTTVVIHEIQTLQSLYTRYKHYSCYTREVAAVSINFSVHSFIHIPQ